MTLSREVRRFAVPIALSTCFAGQLAAAPGFGPMRPAFGIAPRPVVASRVPPSVRGGDLRRTRHEGEGGGRFPGSVGVGIAVLPVVPPFEPSITAGPASQDYEPVGRSDERWAWDEPPQRASCIRPLIIDLRPLPKTRQPGPRVIYGTAPPVCPRS